MLKEILQKYETFNEQERIDKNAMLMFIEKFDNTLLRENLIAHFTNSALIINKEKTKVLFINHLIYKSWGWVGGHNDGNPNFLEVVMKEALEETGLKNVVPFTNEPVSLDIINVPNHIKNGKYIGDHLHLNLAYILIADENEEIKIKVDENSGVKWFSIEDVLNYVTEERMKYIYSKMFKYINNK